MEKEKPKAREPDNLKERFTADLKEAKNYMEPIQQRMDRDYLTYRNNPNADDPTFKVSDFYSYVETVVPIVTNNRIRANVRSDYPDYVTHAKGLNDILDHTYDVNNWDYKSQEIMRMAMIYRSAFAYTGYDPDYRNIGKLCIEIVNPRWCLVDPSAIELGDSRFFFYVQPMRKTQVFKLHPDKKADIERSMGSKNRWDGSGTDSNSWFKTWVGNIKNFLTFNQDATQAKKAYDPLSKDEITEEEKHKNVIAYIHYWYRDDDDEWRCSYWADDCFLKDEANPFWHGKLPYDILSPVKDPLSMLGVSLNDQIQSMSNSRNDMMNYIITNSELHANPPLLWNTAFGNVRDPQSLQEQNKGKPIMVNNPDMVPLQAIADHMTVPTMPGYATSLFEQLGNIQDEITGVNDSFRGTQQATSGKEVQLQQEAAYTRIKTMVDQVELFNQGIAEKTIVNSMQFLTTDRAFRIKGDYTKYDNDKQMNEEMPFEVEPIQKGVDPETNEPVNDRTEFFLYANPNEWTKLKPDGEEKEKEADKESAEKAFKILQMTVEIESGSSLPQSRLARREEAAELFGAGAIDQQALLDIYDWPDREEIMKRMQEKAQQQQEAEAQAAQAQSQAQMQMEQMKMEQQMQLEQMKIQADMQKAQTGAQQPQEQGAPQQQGQQQGLAEIIDIVRQEAPEAAQLTDEQIIQAVTG